MTAPDKPVFGQYACAGPSGAIVRVGDEVLVTQRVNRNAAPLGPASEMPSHEADVQLSAS